MSLTNSSFFIQKDRTVKACGQNSYGQLGIGNTTQQTSPVTLPVTDVKQIACGSSHTFLLLNDGTAKACGYNGKGQLGTGNTTQQTSPVTVPITGAKQISCGGSHTFFLLNDGTVKACGNNAQGQLGTGNTTQQTSPVTVPVTDVKQIACGTNHTVFLLNDGTVKACGYNIKGQLGIGNTTDQKSPVTVPITDVKYIACGDYHSFFLLNDGTVKACGNSPDGQLGTGNTTQQNSPVTVPVTDVKQIACGSSHTFLLLKDRTVKACGYNAQGQLGTGNTTQQTSPVTVPVTNVKQIACGSSHTFLLLNDGTVKACGYNGNGQLGIGNTTNQTSPVTVPVTGVKILFDCLANIDFLFCLIKQNENYMAYKDGSWIKTGLTDFDLSQENPACFNNYSLHGIVDLSAIPQEKMLELSGNLELCAYIDSSSDISIGIETDQSFQIFKAIEGPTIYTWTDSEEPLAINYDTEVYSDILYSLSKDSVSFYGYKNNSWQKDTYMTKEELELIDSITYQELFGKTIYKEKLYIKILMKSTNDQQELLLKELTVTYKDNTPPIFIDTIVTPDSFHDEYVSIAGTLKDYEGDTSKYRISIKKANQPDYMIIDDWANISNESQLLKAYNYTYFAPGENKIKIEAKDSRNAISFVEYSVVLLNTGPFVTFTYNDFSISGTIRDDENDTVSYRVSINGVLKFDYLELSASPKDFKYEWQSDDLLFGKNNTIKIEVIDSHGGYAFNEFIIVGKYKGMMIKDPSGAYYSDDKSNLLKWLDFGTLIGGQTSPAKRIILENSNGFAVDEVLITVGDVYSSLTDLQKIDMLDIELSETESPFVPKKPFKLSTPMNNKDEKEMFVKVVTDKYSRQGGEFKITADAKPVI